MNRTRPHEYEWSYEYYFDYTDPVLVDAASLSFYRYSVVLMFWTVLAMLVSFFFLTLLLLSRTKHLPRAAHEKKSDLLLTKH